jgi:molecular chaperone GrpE
MGKNRKRMEKEKSAGKNRVSRAGAHADETAAVQNGSGKEEKPEESKSLTDKDDKYLRLAAEFDNYRKRTLREKAELTRLAGEEILIGLLPVVDDFDRAIRSLENTGDVEAMKKGLDLIAVKLRDFLKQNGVKEIEAKGNEFDTDLHEAITKIPAASKKDKGKIVDVVEKGYLLHDKVIRYSKVVIGE